MTDQPASPFPRLWTPRSGFVEDAWRHADSADGLSGNQSVTLPMAAFRALDAATLQSAADRIGVLVAPGEALDAILPFLGSLPLVGLAFPAFNDGRSYSKAEVLRTRHGYAGVLRATGQVLIDQIPLMVRAGFDQLEVSHPTALKRLEEGRVGGLPLAYQPAPAGDAPAGETYSWRRRPAG